MNESSNLDMEVVQEEASTDEKILKENIVFMIILVNCIIKIMIMLD
mgnify:CR=1 FL=1